MSSSRASGCLRARKHRGELTIHQIEIDENAETPQRFGVMSIPTLLLFRDGEQVVRLDGLIREEDLKQALAIGMVVSPAPPPARGA